MQVNQILNKLKNLPSDLSNLKTKVDKLDVDKLVPVPVDLSKLSDAVKNDIFKNDVINAKITYIEDKMPGITDFSTNTNINAKINEVQNEIHIVTNLATTAALSAKLNKFKNKIPNITNLATTPDLTVVENKIRDYSKQITTSEFNKLTAETFPERLEQINLASKKDIANFVKKDRFKQ